MATADQLQDLLPPATPANTATYTIRLRTPHEKQLLFCNSPSKRIIIRAGRRGGKTTGIAIRASQRFLRNRRVLYAAPTLDQVAKFWAEIKVAFAEPLAAGVLYKNETEHIIGYADPAKQARIRAKTAWNADTLRGDYADDLILDEWQLMNESAWEEVGAPMLIDNNGDAVFIYTPPSLHTKTVSKARDLRHASKMYKKAMADKSGRWQAIHFTSHDNPHVSTAGLEEITIDMTALAYRQEIMAEDIDEVPGALWTRKLIEETRTTPQSANAYARVVVGVDPSGSSTTEAGVVAAGMREDGEVDILADRSVLAPTPRAWATAAVQLYYDLNADRIVGERNFGGDMVESTVRTVDENVSYKDVTASRGKLVRAEPVAALFEKSVAHMAGKFEKLEEECCSYVPGNKSPNRLDAAVWAVTELVQGGALGLIDWYKQGHAQKEVERLNKPVDVGAVLLAKYESEHPSNGHNGNGSNGHDLSKVQGGGELADKLANDNSPRCPECQSALIATVAGGMNRCQQCGVQWWPKDAPAVARPQSRSDYLAKMGGRH